MWVKIFAWPQLPMKKGKRKWVKNKNIEAYEPKKERRNELSAKEELLNFHHVIEAWQCFCLVYFNRDFSFLLLIFASLFLTINTF